MGKFLTKYDRKYGKYGRSGDPDTTKSRIFRKSIVDQRGVQLFVQKEEVRLMLENKHALRIPKAILNTWWESDEANITNLGNGFMFEYVSCYSSVCGVSPCWKSLLMLNYNMCIRFETWWKMQRL